MNFVRPEKISRRYKSSKTPYWNFFRVVLAGWMIRYPKPFFVAFGFILVMIYNALTN
jgi:hypothetical protein